MRLVPSREHFLDVFRDAEYIVVPSGSCTAMISHHYADLFATIPRGWSRRAACTAVWEFSKFLLDVAGVEDVGARSRRVAPITIAAMPCVN